MSTDKESQKPAKALFTPKQFDGMIADIHELAQKCADEICLRRAEDVNPDPSHLGPPMFISLPEMKGKAVIRIDYVTRKLNVYEPFEYEKHVLASPQANERKYSSLVQLIQGGLDIVFDHTDSAVSEDSSKETERTHVFCLQVTQAQEPQNLRIGREWDNADIAHHKDLSDVDELDTSFMDGYETEDERVHATLMEELLAYQKAGAFDNRNNSIAQVNDNIALDQASSVDASNSSITQVNGNVTPMPGEWESFFLKPTLATIWSSERERDAALQIFLAHPSLNTKGPVTNIPGIFTHGVRFVRHYSGGDSDLEHLDARECRTLIITNLPKNIDLGTVLAQLRGKLIIKALVVTDIKPYGPKAVVVHFSTHKCAQKMFDYYQEHPLYFWGGSNKEKSSEAAVMLPDTDSYPVSRYVDHIIKHGKTRHIEFNMTIGELWAVLQAAGLGVQHFGGSITAFSEIDTHTYRVEFSSLHLAEKVQIAHVRIHDMNCKPERESGSDSAINISDDEYDCLAMASDLAPAKTMKFLPDSCNQPLDTLQATLPISGKNMGLHFTELMFAREGVRLMVSDDVVGSLHAHLPIPEPKGNGWYMESQFQYQDHMMLEAEMDKTADWSSDEIIHWDGKNKEGRLCRWSKDPRSGAQQFEVYLNGRDDGKLATPTMYRDEFVKEWIYYNLDSQNPETQEALDQYFESHGLLNLRKIDNKSAKSIWPLPPWNFASYAQLL